MINSTSKSIRKKEILRVMQMKTDLCGEDCEDAYNAILETMQHFVLKDCKINLHGFGTFEPKELQPIKTERLGHVIDVPHRKSIKFTPSNSLRDKMNGKH